VTSPTNGANGIMAPLPCPPPGISGDSFYIMANGIYLVDAADDAGASPSEIEAQANSVSNLIAQIETTTATQTSRAMGVRALDDSGPPSFSDTNDDGGNFYTNLLSLPPINTNILWLQITNVANGLAYLNLNMATDSVYAILGTSSLLTPFTNWQVLAEVWPTNETTNVLPFTVETDNSTNLFWQAEDWTGVTLNGNTTPVWWFWNYFGTEDLSDTNLDSQGNTLLSDYENGLDPNIIDFTLSTTNKYVRSSNVSAQINLTAGWPSYYAALVNDTNDADAIWRPYPGTNLLLTLGSTNGIYNVWVGLRGLPTNATPTWNSFDLQYLYQTLPPVLTITNPVSGTVTQPMIQIQGFANVPLASLRYDLSNTNGLFTNQTGYLTSQYYDPNQLAATTNYFQCYDVPMTLGSNTITLHAVDLAGNAGTTNFNLTLDYSGVTNPPALALVWPQPGTLIGGSNFTLQATVNDDTAKVAASIAGANGVTNTVAALVERNGNVWANNLPLAAGTNRVTLTATNAAGLVNTTNFTVVQSAVNLTVNPISSDQLNQTTVIVTGTVTPGQKVYVNGMQASVDGSGHWTASSVPVNPTGTASLNVQAVTPDGSLDSAQVANQAQPVMVVLAGYNGGYSWGDENSGQDENVNWTYDMGGEWEYSDYNPINSGTTLIKPRRSGLGAQPLVLGPNAEFNISADGSGFTPPSGFTPTWQNEQSPLANGGGNSKLATLGMVAPSGPSVAGQSQLYLVEACAMEFSDPYDDDYNLLEQKFGGGSTGDVPVPPESLAINGQPLVNTGETNTDGSTWGATIISAPAGATPQFTVSDDSSDGLSGDYTFANQAFPAVIQSLTVVSNSATQIDATNWGVVESTTATNYVIVQATLSFGCTNATIATNAALLAEAGVMLQWTGGQPVPGNPLQREVPTTNSVETTVTASLGSSTTNLNVWVIWATMNIVMSGTNPSPLSFTSTQVALPRPNNQLGIEYLYQGVFGLGLASDAGVTNAVIGNICAVATITPSGIHSIITNGWNFFQEKNTVAFTNGDISEYNPPWTSDGPNGTNVNKTMVPDTGDKLYGTDSPLFSLYETSLNTAEAYLNFYDYITWNSQVCSNTNDFWSLEARWKTNSVPQFTLVSLGTNLISIPTNSYYPPP